MRRRPLLPINAPRAMMVASCLAFACLASGVIPVEQALAQADGAPQRSLQTDTKTTETKTTAAKTTQAKKPPRNKYGSPLDTLMTTHLWTDVPPAQDFVTQTRPDAKALDYTPLTGTDPDRPKPRDAANIMALQAELQEDGARNERKARVLRPAPKHKAAPAQP